MTPDTPPPRGLRWAATRLAANITTIVAVVALLASFVLGVRQQRYVSCVADAQRAAFALQQVVSARTKAIAVATDAERAAQRRLLAAATPAERDAIRAQVIATYDATDRVRAANPPPAPLPAADPC